jgi:tripartite-type tricarboxylate transporter receptor subunit TctC
MCLRRRRLVTSFILLALAFCTQTPALADEYPSRPITFIVSFAPGGVADMAARLFAGSLQRRLGQTIVVENRPGAGGDVAAGVVARSAPDGYTLLFTTSAFAVNLALQKSKQFTANDFTALAFPASSPEVLAVNAQGPVHTLADLLKLASTKPLNFGSAGVGTSPHIMGEYFFKYVAKAPAVHIPFQGGAPATTALLGNQIDVLSAIIGGGVAAQIAAGKFRGIALADESRMTLLPDIPTFAEAGYPDMDFVDWVGVFSPSKIDPAVAKRFAAALEEVLKEPEVTAKLKAMGFDPIPGSSAHAQADFQTDLAKWTRVVKAVDLKLN